MNTFYNTPNKNQQEFSKKSLFTAFFANEATGSDKRIIEFLIRMIVQLKSALPRAEYIAQSLNICKRTVFRCLAKIKELGLFEIRNRFKHGRKKASLYKLASWAHTSSFISFLASYLPALRRLTCILVFNAFPVQKSFAECKLPFYSSKEMSPRIIYRFNLLNLKKDIILPMRVLSKKETKKGVVMYPTDKPDYVKTFSREKKPQQREEQHSTTRRYPVYVHEPPKQRDYKKDAQEVIAWLSSSDPKYKLGHDFLASLPQDVVTKLVTQKMAPKDPENE